MAENEYKFEVVYVETPVDTDCDGKYDLIKVYIKRPIDSSEKNKVPCLYVANPYMLSCNEDWYIPHNVDCNLTVFPEQNIRKKDIEFNFDKDLEQYIHEERNTMGQGKAKIVKEDPKLEEISELYDHFLKRGYGAVFAGGLGTLGSEGIVKTGSREEILAFKSVIDWLNGRARAFTDKENNIEVKADWTTGKVAMTGKSYLGTLSIGVASTGVEGLETIIPEAAISNWYNYYRYNGLNSSAIGWQGDDLDILSKYCFSKAKDEEKYKKVQDIFEYSQARLILGQDRISGNYNSFWDERNYLNQLHKIKASVFIIHGLNDWNVKTNQCYPLFQRLEELNIPRKIVLHQGEHIYIYNLRNSGVLKMLENWLDFYLKGIDTGIQEEPKVYIQSNVNQNEWNISNNWGFKDKTLFPIEEKGTIIIEDDLSKTIFNRDKDNLKEWLDELVLTEKVDYKNRVKYIWDLEKEGLEKDVHFSGQATISFNASIDQNTAILSAMLVDLGDDCRITNQQDFDEDGMFAFCLEEKPSSYKVITRGWLNAQNRNSIWSKENIEKKKYYNYQIEFIPTDYIIRKNHKIALIIYGIDAEATQRPFAKTQITIKQETIQCHCPIKK
ncbi:MAG: Xaa-Pro dipeptidyl-peptidase [Tissierellia bacterium]|nr:Xaa-Pro dipeptidyl-peptidase [Tissierellia bacterium]